MKFLFYIIVWACMLQSSFVCGQGLDCSPAGIMISHGHPKGGWMLTYSYMNMMMKNNLSGAEKVSDETVFSQGYSMSAEKMQMDMHMLMAMYGFTGRLSGMVMANYQAMSMDMQSFAAFMHMHDGTTMASADLAHTHQSSGIGDVKVYALYKLLNGKASSLVFVMGLNIPTGDIYIEEGEHALYAGQRQSYMMQLGSGSFDLMPGVTYLQKRGKVSWSAQALSTIRPFDNSIGYHLGDDLTLNAWSCYQFCPLVSASLRAEGYISGVVKGNDPAVYSAAEPAANPNNYGGERISGYAGVNFYINKGALKSSKLGAEFGIPIYQYLNGPQLAVSSVLNLSFSKAF